MAAAARGPLRVGVMGAGAIGCFFGVRLAVAGCDVRFVGRPSLADVIARDGLTVTDLSGRRDTLPPAEVDFQTSVTALDDRELVLFCVKGLDTESAARELAEHLPVQSTVLSLQNGVRNIDTLTHRLPGQRVLAGMVPFNVVRDGATLAQATDGTIFIDGAAEPRVVDAMKQVGLPLAQSFEMLGVLWCKLLFNLNNAINALSGLPLRDELSDRGYRRVLARCMREGLAVLKLAGIRPVRIGRMIPQLAVRMLPWPDAVFSRAARAMIDIDPQARSSMYDDLSRGRATEIDLLNGEVVALGARVGRATPQNARIVELVRAAERAGAGSPGLPPDAINAPA